MKARHMTVASDNTEPLAEFPEGEEFSVVLDCGRRRLRLALA